MIWGDLIEIENLAENVMKAATQALVNINKGPDEKSMTVRIGLSYERLAVGNQGSGTHIVLQQGHTKSWKTQLVAL